MRDKFMRFMQGRYGTDALIKIFGDRRSNPGSCIICDACKSSLYDRLDNDHLVLFSDVLKRLFQAFCRKSLVSE